ncbi:MAG: discoidin domain-containing protein [Dysgonomonas sp.]
MNRLKCFVRLSPIFLSIFLFSCKNRTTLESALIQAGENRAQLEQVLDHYKNDTLKYKAACFLIENLPMHYSYGDTLYFNNYYNEIDSLADLYNFPHHDKKDSLYRAIRDKYSSTFSDHGSIVEDIKNIPASYLIENIDRAFDVWLNNPFTRHVNFEDFCEYILPYKCVEAQILDNWREYLGDYSKEALEGLEYCDLYKNSAYKACEAINDDLRNKIHPRLWAETGIPVTRMKTLLRVPYGSCDNYCILALSLMRAQGIPSTIDFIPQWPFRSMGHSWNVLLDNYGKNVIFEGAFARPGLPHKEDHKMAKVFRRTYSANKELLEIYKTEKYIPDAFRTPFCKDVTNEYMRTSDITLDVGKSHSYNYAYLAVFDDQKWIPTCWGKKEKKKVTFNDVGRDIAYLPVSYSKEGASSIGYPFILSSEGEKKELLANLDEKQTLTLYRKYPLFPHADYAGKRMIGGKIQASNYPDFRDAVTIHTISKAPLAEDVHLNNDSLLFQYWRYLSPDLCWCNIAELAFFEKDSVAATYGKIIGTEGSCIAGYTHTIKAAFDGDILTYFDAPTWSDSWLGMDFGRKVNIRRVTCIPRGDGNNIEIGNEYELMYWSDGSWTSLGKKIADDIYLKYEDCPTNALFLLHNHTKGKEERIFTYENGRQIWW